MGSRGGDRPSLGCLLYLAADQVMPRRGVTKVPCKQVRVDSRLWVTVVAATFLELRENGSIDVQLRQGQSYMQVILGARNASPQHGLPGIALRGLHDEAGSFGHTSLPQALSRISHDNGRALGYLASYVKQDVIWELVECGYYRATILAGRFLLSARPDCERIATLDALCADAVRQWKQFEATEQELCRNLLADCQVTVYPRP